MSRGGPILTAFRGLPWLARAYLLQVFRSRTALIWNLAFPLLWLFVFGVIFARGDVDRLELYMPGVFSITVMSSAFFGVSYLMVREREEGILRRYRVTPVTASALVTANSIRAVVTLAISLAVQWLVGWAVFGIRCEGSVLAAGAMMLLGAIAFVPLGLIIGSVAQDMRTAPAIANVLFFPMLFATGVTVPLAFLPGWVQEFARLLPPTYLVEGLMAIFVRGEGLTQVSGPVAVMLLTALVGAAGNALLFRWESTEPINRRNLAIALGGLLAFYLAVAVVGPRLRMVDMAQEAAESEAAAESNAAESEAAETSAIE